MPRESTSRALVTLLLIETSPRGVRADVGTKAAVEVTAIDWRRSDGIGTGSNDRRRVIILDGA